MNAAIAQHLNIAESAIIRVEEWANVLFVVCRKLGARFVSKKVMANMISLEEAQAVYGDSEAIQRNYVNEAVISAAYEITKGIKEANLANLVVDGRCDFPATRHIIDAHTEGFTNRQIVASQRIAAYLLSV